MEKSKFWENIPYGVSLNIKKEDLFEFAKHLLNNAEQIKKGSSTSEILNLEQTCELTNYKRATIYKMVSEEKIPVYSRHGRKLLFSRTQITEWLAGKNPTQEDFILAQERKMSSRKGVRNNGMC